MIDLIDKIGELVAMIWGDKLEYSNWGILSLIKGHMRYIFLDIAGRLFGIADSMRESKRREDTEVHFM